MDNIEALYEYVVARPSLILAILSLYFLCSSVLFAFYVYYIRLNKVKEENVPIYPIIRHFYKTAIYMQLSLYLIIIISILFCYSQHEPLSKELVLLNGGILYFYNCVSNTVHNILLFVLAFRSFVLVVLPDKWHYEDKSSAFQYFLRYLCIIVIFANILLFSYSLYTKTFFSFTDGYVIIDWIFLSSSIFYILMFLKVRNFSKLINTMKTKPEKYIFYHTIIIISTKMMILPLLYALIPDKLLFTFHLVATDVLTRTFIIQLSYLICNKTQLEKFLSTKILKLKQLIMYVFRSRSSVFPEQYNV